MSFFVSTLNARWLSHLIGSVEAGVSCLMFDVNPL